MAAKIEETVLISQVICALVPFIRERSIPVLVDRTTVLPLFIKKRRRKRETQEIKGHSYASYTISNSSILEST